MRSRLVATFLAASFTTSYARLAYATDPPPEARRAFADGKAAYDQGDYETALRDFERARRLAPAPSLYYNIGMAYERMGRFGESASSFDRYLAEVGPARNDDERTAQDKVRERAAADRARAQGAMNAAPPAYDPPPPPPPQQPPPGYAPYYYYAPYGQPMMMVVPRAERIRRATQKRNAGIVLLAIGGVLLAGGATLIAVGATTDGDTNLGVYLGGTVGGTFALLGGIAFTIPGAVLTARGQTAINDEKHMPDDGAATRRSALDLAAPGARIAQSSLSLALPPVRF